MYDLEKMASEFKPGDKVYVLRAADENEHGWKNQWTEKMDERVGKTNTIVSILGQHISLRESQFLYPPFVLEKITCDNPFKVGDKVRVRLPHRKCDDLTVERLDDLFVFEGSRTVRHKYCTLIPTKKTWTLGCQQFHWDGDLFKSDKVSVSRNQLKAIYEQANSVCAPTSWRIGGFPLQLNEIGFGCDGCHLGTVDDLKKILDYKKG